MQISLTGSKPLKQILLELALYSIPLAITLQGGRALISCAYIIYMGTASEQWPRIPAIITASSVIDGLGLRGKKCIAHVEYEFTIDGVHFRGQTLQFGQPLTGQSDAEEIVAKYPIGADVDALYCPENPSLSVLESGYGSTVPSHALFGGVFFTAGIFGIRALYKEWKKQGMKLSRASRSKR